MKWCSSDGHRIDSGKVGSSAQCEETKNAMDSTGQQCSASSARKCRTAGFALRNGDVWTETAPGSSCKRSSSSFTERFTVPVQSYRLMTNAPNSVTARQSAHVTGLRVPGACSSMTPRRTTNARSDVVRRNAATVLDKGRDKWRRCAIQPSRSPASRLKSDTSSGEDAAAQYASLSAAENSVLPCFICSPFVD